MPGKRRDLERRSIRDGAGRNDDRNPVRRDRSSRRANRKRRGQRRKARIHRHRSHVVLHENFALDGGSWGGGAGNRQEQVCIAHLQRVASTIIGLVAAAGLRNGLNAGSLNREAGHIRQYLPNHDSICRYSYAARGWLRVTGLVRRLGGDGQRVSGIGPRRRRQSDLIGRAAERSQRRAIHVDDHLGYAEVVRNSCSDLAWMQPRNVVGRGELHNGRRRLVDAQVDAWCGHVASHVDRLGADALVLSFAGHHGRIRTGRYPRQIVGTKIAHRNIAVIPARRVGRRSRADGDDRRGLINI